MSEILSKGDFRDLPHLRLKEPECFLGDPTNSHRRQVHACINAYDKALDALHATEQERDAMRRDITRLVTTLPVDGKTPRFRLVLVGMMLPWLGEVFVEIKTLCNHVRE